MLCIMFLLSGTIHATKYYVDLVNGNDGSSGANWDNARLTLASAATLGASWDSILVKGNTWTTNATFAFPASRKYFGSCAGSEIFPSQRPMSDNDLNGIIEPWEFTNATVMSSTFTGNAFTYPNSGITVDGFTFTQTQNALTANNRTLTLGYTSNVLVNSIIKDCNLTATVSASPFAMVLSCGGSVSNCLIEKNTVSVATSGGTDCNIQPIIGVNGGIFSNNIVRNNKANLDFSGGTSGLSNTRGLILMITPSTTQNTSLVSNCVIHNNEVYFKGNTNTSLSNGAIVAMHNSPLLSYAYLYNCIIANNKATAFLGHTAACWGLKVIYAGTNTVAHNVYNNVFWNNTGTTGAVGAVTAGTQAGYGVLTNNVGNGGTILNNTSPNGSNLSDLAATNTGTSAPYFNTPTTTAGNLSDGTVEKSVWSINNSSSYLAAKGATIATLTTDKAGNTYSTTPSRAAGAYELVLAFRSNATGNWATANKWQSTRDNTTWVTATSNPSSNACPISIQSGHIISIGANATASTLAVKPGGKLTLESGKILKTNTLTLENNASGVGSFVDNGGTLTTTTATAQQDLSVARNWYMSSPVSGAASLPTVNTGTVTFYAYPENDANQATGANGYAAGGVWNTVSSGTLATGGGYIIKPSAVSSIVTFSGTSFNTGDKTITGLTYSATNPKSGFNLIGNPYPSYLNVLPSVNANLNLEPTVWYRTRDTNETPLYHFETVNTTTGVGTNASGTGRVTGYIPPMQSFWVRTAVNNQSITLSNTERSHATTVNMTGIGTVPTTTLKAPKSGSQPFSLLGLYLSNGITGDETILMFTSEASNSLDRYDSKKLSNNNASIPEIYTAINSERLAINGMNSVPETELPLGFTTGKAGNFTLKASELSNFDSNTRIYLLDKQENSETELTTETEYAFSTTAATSNNESRFSLLFRAPGVTTGTTNTEREAVSVFVNTQNQITIIAKKGSPYAIYNTMGQLIENGVLNSERETRNAKHFVAGVYLVKVNNQSTRVVVK